jgi:hypothetical protein
MNISRNPLVVASVALAAALAMPTAMAADKDGSNGMRVMRDPVTGQLRAPTHEEFKQMQEDERAAKASSPAARTAPASIAAPVQLQRQDGSRGMRVGKAFMSYAVVTRKSDGSLDMDCVTGDESAQKVVQGAVVAPAKSEGHDHDAQ